MLGIQEGSPQMRRSISMPVKPQHLEPETLKRSAEKETVFATTDEELSSDGEDNSDTLSHPKKQQCAATPTSTTTTPTPLVALTADDDSTQADNDEESKAAVLAASKNSQRALSAAAKPFRSVRDFLSPIFTMFRKTPTWSATTATTTTTRTTTATGVETRNCKASSQQKESLYISKSSSFSGCIEHQTGGLSSANGAEHSNGHLTTKGCDDFQSSATANCQQSSGHEKVTFTLT